MSKGNEDSKKVSAHAEVDLDRTVRRAHQWRIRRARAERAGAAPDRNCASYVM